MINLARIRYITSHFNVLRGLTVVPWGIYYLLGALFTLTYSSADNIIPIVVLIGGLLLAGLVQWLLFNYYQKTIGVVDNPMHHHQVPLASATRRKLIGLWIGYALVTILAGLFACWQTPIIDPGYSSMFIYKLLLAIAVCLLCLTLWLQERIKEGYGHIPVWPLATYLILTLEPPGFLRNGATITIENCLIGFLFLFAGLYNHLFLTGSFRPFEESQRNREESSHARSF